MTENRNCKRQLNISTGVKKSAFLCKNRHNQGFSLVEVLVAMAILAIISLPILTSFANSAKINAKARRVENANTVASDVVEQFKSMSIDELTAKYAGKYHRYESVEAAQAAMSANNAGSPLEETREAQVTDCYVFTVESTGNNGEAFETKVLLDPSAYTNGGIGDANETNNINSYAMPQYSSLSSDKNVLIRDEVYADEVTALKEVNATGDTGAKVKKTMELHISISESDSILHTYMLNVGGSVIYANGTKTFEVPYTKKSYTMTAQAIEGGRMKLSAEQGVKNVYLFYTPFDTTLKASGVYSSDEIKITYDYPDKTLVDCSDCNIYIVQQNKQNGAGQNMLLNKSNVSVTINGGKPDLVSKGTLNLSKVTGELGPVSIYSNIDGWNSLGDESTKNNGISHEVQTNGQGYLYRMTIQVNYEGEQYTAVTATKEN